MLDLMRDCFADQQKTFGMFNFFFVLEWVSKLSLFTRLTLIKAVHLISSPELIETIKKRDTGKQAFFSLILLRER